MEQVKLINEILDIAQSNKNGFTYCTNTKKLINCGGYAVALKETQNSFNIKGLIRVLKHNANKNTNLVGGWYNSENKSFYFDSIIIFNDLIEAVNFARKNEQIAIFNLDSKEVLNINYNFKKGLGFSFGSVSNNKVYTSEDISKINKGQTASEILEGDFLNDVIVLSESDFNNKFN